MHSFIYYIFVNILGNFSHDGSYLTDGLNGEEEGEGEEEGLVEGQEYTGDDIEELYYSKDDDDEVRKSPTYFIFEIKFGLDNCIVMFTHRGYKVCDIKDDCRDFLLS